MYKRFSKLVNDLKDLRKNFETIELVKKIIRSLPKSWNMIVMTIEELKNLSKMGMDELIISLLIYR